MRKVVLTKLSGNRSCNAGGKSGRPVGFMLRNQSTDKTAGFGGSGGGTAGKE